MMVFNLEGASAILRSYARMKGWRKKFRDKLVLEALNSKRQRYTHIEAVRDYKERILLDFADNKIIRLAETVIRIDKPDNPYAFLEGLRG